MTTSIQSLDATPLHSIAHPPTFTTTSSLPSNAPSSTNSSDHEDTDLDTRTILAPRPRNSIRKISGTSIVHRDHPHIEIQEENFPPDDARAMSPRRTSLEMEKLGAETRKALQRHAITLQSGLNALAEKIEVVKLDHEKLEKQNVALQDYIGGLTKSMSRTDLTTKSKK